MEQNEHEKNQEFIKMLEMARTFSEFMHNDKQDYQGYHDYKEEKVMSKYIPIQFDEKIQTKEMKIIKTALPYLEPYVAKNLSILIKIIELKNIIQSNDHLCAIQNITADNQKSMLIALRPHLEIKDQQIVDMFLKIFEMKNIFYHMM